MEIENMASTSRNISVVLGIAALFIIGAFIAGGEEGSQQKGALTSVDVEACSETDDGIAPYYKGTIAGPAAGSSTKVSYVDRCQDNSVIEYYCSEGVVRKIQMDCKTGCNEGACVLASQGDSR